MYLSTLFTVTLSAILLFPTSVVSWGSLGHRTVGYLAEKYFTPDGQKFFDDLVKPTDTFDISDAAVWADKIRRTRPVTAPWHFIDAKDNPPQECKVNFRRDCKAVGCVVSALLDMSTQVTDLDLDPVARQEAVKFILHFVGDLTQPLHTEDLKRGGNDINVTFEQKHTNLHSLWDTYFIEQALTFKEHEDERTVAQNWAQELFTEQAGDPSEECAPNTGGSDEDLTCILSWASQSNAFICAYVLNGVDLDVSRVDISTTYYEGALRIIQGQIGNAARRFANWMNVLGSSSALVVQDERRMVDL